MNAELTVNWLAVLVAAVSSFVVGGLWYGPVFGRIWMKENGFTEQALAGRNMGVVFGGAFVFSLIASINLAMFLGPDATIGFGAMAGCLAGLGWVAMFTGIQYLFEMRTLKLYLVNAGYSVVALTVMGLIIGAWR